jgi:exodeoxyribonuclease VII small subunit
MREKRAESYAASIARLQKLVARLESAEIDVDELEAVVKESVSLVTSCRARLRATQSSVDTLLSGLQEGAASAPAAPVTLSVAAVDEDELDPFAEE